MTVLLCFGQTTIGNEGEAGADDNTVTLYSDVVYLFKENGRTLETVFDLDGQLLEKKCE